MQDSRLTPGQIVLSDSLIELVQPGYHLRGDQPRQTPETQPISPPQQAR